MVTRRWSSLLIALVMSTSLPVDAGQSAVDGGDDAPNPRAKLFQRWLWHWGPRGSATVDAAPDPIGRALNSLDVRKRTTEGAAPAEAVRGRWIDIGPAPILGGQVGLQKNERSMNGRVRAVAVDPDDHQHWLIGAAQGGIWETFDGGRTWTATSDDSCSLAMGAIAFGAPNSATGLRTVYAGTGEASPAASAYGGRGLLVRDDPAAGWQVRPRLTDDRCPPSPFVGLAFSRVLAHPRNPKVVVAATVRPGYAVVSSEQKELQRTRLGVITTDDGGQTWHQPTCGLPPETPVDGATDIVANPASTDMTELYAGFRLAGAGGGYGVYRRSPDGCWKQVLRPGASGMPGNAVLGRIEFAFKPPSTLYISIADNGRRRNGLLGLWRTDDAWGDAPVFKPVSLTGGEGGGPGPWGYCGAHPTMGVQPSGAKFEGLCYYAHTITVDPKDSLDPTNADIVYAGGIGLWKALVTCQAERCDAAWSEISHLTSPYPHTPRLRRRGIHVDQQAMAWAGRRLIVVNDGGVWSTTDGGANWQDHNRGLSVVQFYAGAVAEYDGQLLILGGTQDNGTVRWTGTSWVFVKGGDAGRPVISSRRPATDWGLAYVSIVDGRTIQRTLDGGVEFMRAESPIKRDYRERYFPAPPLARCGSVGSPGGADTVVAGAGPDLWKSPSFFASATSPTWDWIRVAHEEHTVTTLAIDPANCDKLAAVIEREIDNEKKYEVKVTSHLSTTSDFGLRLVKRFNSTIKALAFDPGSDRLYVAFSGLDDPGVIRVDEVFREDIPPKIVPLHTKVPVPHTALAVVPDRTNPAMVQVWAGTDVGVLHGHCHRTAAEKPCTWTHHGPAVGMPNVAVSDLQVSESGQVVAFTYGRGAFLFVEGDGWCGGKHVPAVGVNFRPCPAARP